MSDDVEGAIELILGALMVVIGVSVIVDAFI